MGICKWLEAGSTVDTALPELLALTDDKAEWRAVIVQTGDDSPETSFDADPSNPFDFLINGSADEPLAESPVPLIRLTQILGGIPTPDTKFDSEVVQQDGYLPRMIYKPVTDDDNMRLHTELSKKYSFDGKKPTEIHIVKLRVKTTSQLEDMRKTWHIRKEIGSSEFWKRNKYPSMCRFLACDTGTQGLAQREADLFEFWLSVLLLAINRVEPSVLQAYKLYNLGVELDREQLGRTFQQTVNRLVFARRIISESIQRDIIDSTADSGKMPNYSLEIPVMFNMPDDETITAHNMFDLMSPGPARDIGTWYESALAAEAGIDASLRSTGHTLDRAVERMQHLSALDGYEADPLSKYQEKDLAFDLDRLRSEILLKRGALPAGGSITRPDVTEASKTVRDYLRGRTTRSAVFISAWLFAAMLIIFAIPALVFELRSSANNLWGLAVILMTAAAVIALIAFLVLFVQKKRLGRLISEYNKALDKTVTELFQSAEAYSDYLSGIATHKRGSAILAASKGRKNRRGELFFIKYKHIHAIDVLIERIKDWNTAFYMNVNFFSDNIDEDLYVRTELPPMLNPLYMLESEMSYRVDLNSAGDHIDSPYGFVTRFIIAREEIYDDE